MVRPGRQEKPARSSMSKSTLQIRQKPGNHVGILGSHHSFTCWQLHIPSFRFRSWRKGQLGPLRTFPEHCPRFLPWHPKLGHLQRSAAERWRGWLLAAIPPNVAPILGQGQHLGASECGRNGLCFRKALILSFPLEVEVNPQLIHHLLTNMIKSRWDLEFT